MTVQVGDYVYSQQTSGPDADGVTWLYLERRVVLAIEGTTVTLSAWETDRVPTHSAGVANVVNWFAAEPQLPRTVNLAQIDGSSQLYTQTLTLPEVEVIPDEVAVRAAYLAFKNHEYDNRERGKAPPAPADATQRYYFEIIAWRDGLPHPSAG